jgi:phosphatidylinositol-3-phosphatase
MFRHAGSAGSAQHTQHTVARFGGRARLRGFAVVTLIAMVGTACTAGTPGNTSRGAASSASPAGSRSLPGGTGTPTGSGFPAPSASNGPGASAFPLGIAHVFVVVMENQDYTAILGRSSAKYATGLAKTYAYASNYDATQHPSLGNYLDMTAGTSVGTASDCSPSSSCHVSSPSVVDELETAGLDWKGYFESMGTPCRTTDTTSGAYEAHHNPFVYVDSIRGDPARCSAHTVDYGQLATDLAQASTTPNYAFIVPSGPTHDGSHSISGGDAWLSENLPAILTAPACTRERCLLVLTWDEDNYQGRNQVLTVFAGSAAKTGYVSSTAYDHFSLLRTVEEIFGLGTLTKNDAAASPMTDMLK